MKISGEIKIIAGSALFALIPVGVKMAPLAGIQSLLFGRLFFASLFLMLIKKNHKELIKINKADIFPLTLWAGIMCGAMLCYFYAIRSCGVATSSTLLGVQPLLMILLAGLVLKEKIRSASIIAGTLTLLGVWLVTEQNNETSDNHTAGVLLALVSALLLASNFIFQKNFLSHLASDKLVFYQSAFQLPMLLPFLVFQAPSINVGFISASVLLGVFCTVLTYILIYKGASEVSAQKIGVLQSIEYVLPVFIGNIFFAEILTTKCLFGVALITGACILIGYKDSNKSPKINV